MDKPIDIRIRAKNKKYSHICEKLRHYTLKVHLMGLYSKGRLQTFIANIRQGWVRLKVTNTLAYYDTG